MARNNPRSPHRVRQLVLKLSSVLVLLWARTVVADNGHLPDNDIMMKALVAELDRAMDGLKLGDLPTPYFIQYNAHDRLLFSMSSAYGGILRDDENRVRYALSRVRVGDVNLDNTNVGRGFGWRTVLPVDDDLTALRHSIWLMTDTDYKQALEILTRKKAYLRQRMVEDRPDDFCDAPKVVAIEPSAEIAFDRGEWQETLARLSARFKSHPQIQDSRVDFMAGAVNRWIVNSDGTRVRAADTGIKIEIQAEIQAADGMTLSDSRTYLGLAVDDLPPVDEMLGDIDRMCQKLTALRQAPVLEHYTGPVLFDAVAAGNVFDAMLATGLCARPIPLGGGTDDDESFEKKIDRRILPRTFDVYDDPTEPRFEGRVLAGAYTVDDEGVKPSRVNLVENGMLKTLLAGRSPTRKIKQSTGHARAAGFGDAEVSIGCLYISDSEGLSDAELKQELIDAARDEGLDFGLRIESLESGYSGALGNPVYVYKVYVEDGREEIVRGLEFLEVQPRALKRLLAAGKERKVHNATDDGVGRSIIAPAILFEELELTRMEEEFDKPPILESPFVREQNQD